MKRPRSAACRRQRSERATSPEVHRVARDRPMRLCSPQRAVPSLTGGYRALALDIMRSRISCGMLGHISGMLDHRKEAIMAQQLPRPKDHVEVYWFSEQPYVHLTQP